MFLLEESINLLWKVLKQRNANKEHTNKQQNEFLKVASKAVRRTLSYIRDENKRDTKTEEELAGLWADVAVAARPFDSDLAGRCYIKANYWANPNSWSDEEVKKAGIEIKRIEKEIGDYFKGKARAKKSKQQRTIEKTAKSQNEELAKQKGKNQERLNNIIKALNKLRETLTEGQNSTRIQKAREAVESAMSPLKETYDFLHQSIRANCNSCTEDCMDYIKHAIRDYGRGYPALWDKLSSPEFIYELNLAETDQEAKSAQKLEHTQKNKEKLYQTNTFKYVFIPLICALFLGIPSWFLLFHRREPNNHLSIVYCPLSSQIRKDIVTNMRRMRNNFRSLDIKISTTSDKGSRVRHRVAEEIAGILATAGFEAKAVSPIMRFANDTSDVVIKGNESDIELLTQLSKILSRFIKTNTPFLLMKNENFQRGELQIIIAGDPLFSSEGIIIFQ